MDSRHSGGDVGCGGGNCAKLRAGVMTLGQNPNSQDGKTTYSETRRQPRYTFAATTEIVDSSSTLRISGRASEISRKGCYVDCRNSLPVGTILNLQILRDQGTFACKAKIIYVHENFGMGVTFVDASDEQLKILDGWLAELPPESAH